MQPIPLNILTLYADLAQQASEPGPDEGTVVATVVKGVRYLRLQRWVGATRTVEHLGRADDPAVLARAAAAKAAMTRKAERRRVVALLRRAVPGPSTALGRVLDSVSAAGLFRRGAVLVGTGAYQCYPALVGFVLPSASLMTQDADLATADLALSGEVEGEAMETILKRADPTFEGIPDLRPSAPPSRFRSANGFVVDLLTPRLRRGDETPMPLKGLRAGAIPLQQLDWLIEAPVRALVLHGAGVEVLTPRPARFAVHKLIVAQKRPPSEQAKRRKDLMQAKALIEALQLADPAELAETLEEARSRGRDGWARPIARSLSEIGLPTPS